MKRIRWKEIGGVLLLLLLLLLPEKTAYAAGASMGGASGNPGDTVTLVLYVNADGATGVQCNISYDTAVIDSVSVSGANGWTVLSSYPTFMSADMTGGGAALSGNVAVATISAHISAAAAPGASGTVTASGIVCGDPNGGSISCGDAAATVSVNAAAPQPNNPAPAQPNNPAPTTPAETTAAVKSDNASLAFVSAADAAITPEFSADVTEYEVVWEPYVTEPDFTYGPEDDAAAAVMEGELPKPGETADVKITVTAEDGETVKTYVFHCSYSDRPLTPLEIMKLDGETAAEKLAAKDLTDILTVLLENDYFAVKLENQKEGITLEAEGAETAIFAALPQEEQLRILKGERAVVTLTVSPVEEEPDALTAMMLSGAECQSYELGSWLRLKAELVIGDDAPREITELDGEITCRFRIEAAEISAPSAILQRKTDGEGVAFALLTDFPEEEGSVQLSVTELSDLIWLTEVPPVEEKAANPYVPLILAFIGGVVLTGAAAAIVILLYRKRQNRQ